MGSGGDGDEESSASLAGSLTDVDFPARKGDHAA